MIAIRAIFRKAFTLIELLLVILVVSFLTLYAVRMVNSSLENQIQEQTVAQALNIKSAVLAYYAQKRVWPVNLNDLISQNLLTKNDLCSRYVGKNNLNCRTQAPFSGKFISTYAIGAYGSSLKMGYYQLSLTLPSLKSAGNLLNKLPASSIESDNRTITMTIPMPGQVGGLPNRGWIVSGGVVDLSPTYDVHLVHYLKTASPVGTPDSYQLGPQIYLPNCPPGFEGHITVSPLFYNIYTINDGGATGYDSIHLTMTTNQIQSGQYVKHFTTVLPVPDNASIGTDTTTSIVTYWNHNSQQNAYPCNQYPALGQGQCGLTSNYKPVNSSSYIFPYQFGSAKDENGQDNYLAIATNSLLPQAGSPHGSNSAHVVYFLTYCLPLKHWATNYIDPVWAQDGQCTTSWSRYNHYSIPCNVVDPSTPYYSTFNPTGVYNQMSNLVPNEGWNNSGQNNQGQNSSLENELAPVGSAEAT